MKSRLAVSIPILWLWVGLPAAAHPLLDLLPPEVLEDERIHDNVCVHSEKLFIGTATTVTYMLATANQIDAGYPQVFTEVTFTVERAIARAAPLTNTVVLRLPGGQWGTDRLTFPHVPQIQQGSRWAMALQYPTNQWALKNPLILESLRLNPAQALPSLGDLNAAFQEVCQ